MHYCDQTTREKCLWNWRKSLSWCSSELMQMADCHANFLTTVFGSTVASHPNRVGSHRVLKRTTFLAHSRSLVWQFPVEEWDAKWRNYSDFKLLAITDDGFLMSSLSHRSLRGFQNGRQNERLFQRDAHRANQGIFETWDLIFFNRRLQELNNFDGKHPFRQMNRERFEVSDDRVKSLRAALANPQTNSSHWKPL